MRDSISQLIDHLASKELTLGCEIQNKYGTKYTVLCAPFDGWENYGPHVETNLHRDDWFRANQNTQDSLDISHYDPTRTTFSVEQILDKEQGWEILGHPIRLDDVLKHMWKNWKGAYNDKVLELVDLWGKCGFESLQSIFEEAEWEAVNYKTKYEDDENQTFKVWMKIVPKQPHIRELFQFLLQLFQHENS